MAEIPSDPRQLAREILAGRITLEQVAQEQRRRAAARANQAGLPPVLPGANRPVPLPRMAEARPMPPMQQRPSMGTPVPRRVPTEPLRRPPQRVTPQQRPVVRPGAAVARPGPGSLAVASAPPAGYSPPKGTTNVRPMAAAIGAAALSGTAAPLDVRAIFRQGRDVRRSALRQALLLSEILAPPLALREGNGYGGGEGGWR